MLPKYLYFCHNYYTFIYIIVIIITTNIIDILGLRIIVLLVQLFSMEVFSWF